MAELSKASVLRSWKRKVVGSNPGGAEIEHHFLLIGFARRLIHELNDKNDDCKKETASAKLKTTAETIQEGV